MVVGQLQLAGHGGGGPRTPASDGVVAVAAVPEIGGAHELPDAATAMASRSKGLRELSTPPATVTAGLVMVALRRQCRVVESRAAAILLLTKHARGMSRGTAELGVMLTAACPRWGAEGGLAMAVL